MVKSRKVLQLVFELPLEKQAEVINALGVPLPDAEAWCAIARMNIASQPGAAERPGEEMQPNRAGPSLSRPWHTLPLPQQAGILCADERFREWVRETYNDQVIGEKDAADWLRRYVGIASRSDLFLDGAPGLKFRRLVNQYRESVGLAAERRG
jgi:hypothetical protein